MFRVSATERLQRLLPLDYDPLVPPEMLFELERVGRRIGLALHDLEMLGQDAAAIEQFLYELKTGGLEHAHAAAPWAVLEAMYARRTTARAAA